LTFLLLALVAGLLGFFALAGLAATIPKLLLLIFLVLLLVSAFSGALRRGAPRRLRWLNEKICAIRKIFSIAGVRRHALRGHLSECHQGLSPRPGAGHIS
jgi:uncharacterized membrane protein YtjA (UPF0391 family)